MENKIFRKSILLRRIDFINLIFFFYLFGITFHDKLPILIPLRYDIKKEILLTIVLTGMISYNVGKSIAKIFHSKSRDILGYMNSHAVNIILPIFISLSILYFVLNGFPILEIGEDAGELKLALTNQRTYGLTRILYTALPFTTTLFYCRSIVKNTNKFKSYIFILITVFVLSLGLFKGTVMFFLFGLVLIKDKFLKRISINFRLVLGILLTLGFIVSMITFTEINNSADALLYLINRLIIHSWEGLNLIVLKDLPPDISEQFQNFIGLEFSESPDVLLGIEFTGRNPSPLAIVQTLFGFGYRNGGYTLIIFLFITLGIIIQRIIKTLEISRDPLKITTNIFLYLILTKLVLVGNLFNDIRGPLLSLIIINIYFKLKLSEKNTFSRQSTF